MPALSAPRTLCWTVLAGALAAWLGCSQQNPAFLGLPPPSDSQDAAVAPSPDISPRPPDVVIPHDGAADEPRPEPPLERDGAALPKDDTRPVDVDTAAVTPPPDGPAVCPAPAAGTGTGLRAEYFDNSDFTGTRVSRTDPTIDWSFGQGAADPSLDADNFSARWTGHLQPAFSGPHTFVANYDDGMRMFLNERVVMYRWGPRVTTAEDRATVVLEAGRQYDLRFEFFDQGGAATARLFWENSCQGRQIVPRQQLYPVAPAAPVCLVERAAGTGVGLKVEYFSGAPSNQPLATSTASRVDFEWGNGAPTTGVPTDFGTRWSGQLEGPIDGALTIYLLTDDVGRLRLNGVQVMDSWSEPFGPQEIAATIDVRAGQRYDLVIEHRDDQGGALAHLSWSWPCHAKEIIPASRLYLP